MTEPMATVYVDGLPVALRRLRLRDNDLLLVTGQRDEESLRRAADSIHEMLQINGLYVFILYARAGEFTMEKLSEETMREFGWQRIKEEPCQSTEGQT